MEKQTQPSPMQQASTSQGCLNDAANDNADDSAQDGLLDEFLKHLFGSCGGVVDVAAFLMQNTCRDKENAEAKREAEQQPVMRTNLRKTGIATNVKPAKRQGETLVFPSHGGFDDDVSAISAHTLEEMERLEVWKKKNMTSPLSPIPSPARTCRSCSTKSDYDVTKVKPLIETKSAVKLTSTDLDWTYQATRQGSNASRSIGVSTSGSASEDDEPGRIRISPRGQDLNETMKMYTRAEM